MATFFEVEHQTTYWSTKMSRADYGKRVRHVGWYAISLPGMGGVPLRFATLAEAQARYAGRNIRFVEVVDGRRSPAN